MAHLKLADHIRHSKLANLQAVVVKGSVDFSGEYTQSLKYMVAHV